MQILSRTFRLIRGALPLWGLWLLIPALAFAGPRIDSATYVYKQVAGTDLKLDVYAPEAARIGKGMLPTIILFHGGSWKAGNRHQMGFQCRYFAARGMVAVTVDYRLLNKGASMRDTNRKMCLVDAKSAIRWVRSHAAVLHIDTTRVVLGGGSAGGQLATMATLDHGFNDPGDDTSISTRAAALVLFNPAYQMKDDARLEPFGFPPGDFPPSIMCFGSEDHWKRAAEVWCRKLVGAGVPVQIWVAPGQKHGFFNKVGWNESTCRQAVLFLHGLGMSEAADDRAPVGYPLHPDEAADDGSHTSS